MVELTIVVSVVGWFVSPIIKELIDKAQSYLVKKYKWKWGADFRDKLKSVVHFLDEIGCTVSLVKEQRINDPNMMRWLSQLEDVIDEMEDIFDGFDYEILKANQLKNHDATQASSSAAEPGADVIGTDASFKSLIKKLLKKLDDIRQSSRGLVQASLLAATAGCFDGRSGSRSFTGPLLPQEPFGYEDQYGDLKKTLLQGSARVVAIVGLGGMGKTTLAQRACNDVKGEFDLVIWACVYNKFSEADLLGEIWKSVILTEKRDTETDNLTSQTSTISRHGEMSFSSLQQTLEKLVASKRFLLVLDDVCNNEMATELQRRETWSNVLAPFKNGNSGSRILVTTRAKICAKTLDAGARITLDGIDRESFILLIKRTVSANDEASDVQEFREFLESNVVLEGSKCSPLAAKEMGLMLRTTRNRKRWGEILRTDCHENVISVHMSSYQHLPLHLQGCFAFCSIFPDNWKFDPEMLVKMWIAHGFISDGLDGKSMEDVAGGYFSDLLSRSFFQAIKQGATTHYVIHQQIHSMIRLVSANYFMMIQGSCAKKIPLTVRHLSVTSGWLAQLTELRVLKRLRTLLVFKDPESKPLLNADEKFSELKGVRVLDLTGTGITSLPQVIGSLIHLRYLALPDTLLQSFPAAVTKLFHLQTLIESEDCCSINLACSQINLEQLAAMNSLRGKLSITGLGAVANKEGAQRAQIGKKENVRVLHLEWEAKPGNSANTSDLDVLEGLQPHTGLEVLHIRRYRGASSPTWLANNCLKQLTKLSLINCRKWEVLPPFGHLPHLNYLKIKEMTSVERIDGSGSFESLETLVLCDMPSLVEWAAGDTDSTFTSLRKAEISYCPKLVELPPKLTTFQPFKGCPNLQ